MARTGPIQATVVAVTFVLTLLIPLQYAVIVGVGLAIVLHVARQSNRVVITRWAFDADSPLPRETIPPTCAEPGGTIVLVPYGSLFFAAAPVFEHQLPSIPAQCTGTAVVLRLRGKDELGSTFIRVLENYAAQLHTAGGLLILAGVNSRVYDQLTVTKAAAKIGEENLFLASPRLGDSVKRALERVDTWRDSHRSNTQDEP